MSNSVNRGAAKQISCRVFAVREGLRDQVINDYYQYCRLLFILSFINWRLQKLAYKGLPITFDWQDEIPSIEKQVKQIERQLFDDLDPAAAEIVMKNDGQTAGNLRTTLPMKKINWQKDYRLVKIDGKHNFYTLKKIIEDEAIEDPGPCPPFIFMPTKVQLMKMILKAAYSC